MNKKIGILTSLVIATTLMLGGAHEAQAKRMGGGSSFGSKPSYSAPYQRSTSPAPSSQPNRSPAQQQAASHNQTARQGWANRGGLMGLLGGLALGGLLGSLFFGGAFEGINFMDMLLFAGIAFLLYKLFAAKARQSQPAADAYGRTNYTPDDSRHSDYASNQPVSSGSTRFNTDVLFNKGSNTPNAGFDAGNLPAGFDQAAFLAGAESAYRYLQSAWDNRDLAGIRGLTTDKVFAEIQDQLRTSQAANKTEILTLNTELLDAREAGNDQEAAVMFDCLMRENGGQAEQIKEVWHFIRAKNSSQPKWFLDGIQQIEA